MEIVVDEEGTYNGFENAWVCVCVLQNKWNETIDTLVKMGFGGIPASIERSKIDGCFEVERNNYGWITL